VIVHGMDTKDGLSVDAASRIVDAYWVLNIKLC
jgi:hypothetical protein